MKMIIHIYIAKIILAAEIRCDASCGWDIDREWRCAIFAALRSVAISSDAPVDFLLDVMQMLGGTSFLHSFGTEEL